MENGTPAGGPVLSGAHRGLDDSTRPDVRPAFSDFAIRRVQSFLFITTTGFSTASSFSFPSSVNEPHWLVATNQKAPS